VDKTSAHSNNPEMSQTTIVQATATCHHDVTGLLLAGGMGRRMGGADKGLVALDGRPMASWVLDRLRPQVGAMIINANRNPEVWREFGCPVVADQIEGYAGPLAGVHAGLVACTTPLLVTAPCDSPFMPMDLVSRLAAAQKQDGADLAVVRSSDGLQPVFSLMRREVLGSLETFLHDGGRKIDRWFEALHVLVVDFPDGDAFANINTEADLIAVTPQHK
jgi:molybdenum cofactor guanylyltransferase